MRAWWVPAIVAALTLLYFVAPDARLDFTHFDTRDAESYLALSRALASGLGYTRSLDPQFYVPHTTWPPGLPLLLLPAAALAGMPVKLLVVKLGMILYGAAGIWLAYLYAGRLSASRLVRLGAPLLLALDPYYWQFSRMTMSEMPTVLWALVALFLVDIGWSKGVIRPAPAFGMGLLAGFGMLIRGSFFGALFLPLVYLYWRRGERPARSRLALRYLAYAAGFLLPFLGWHVRNSFFDKAALGQDGINQLAMIFRTLPAEPNAPLREVGQIVSDMGAAIAAAIYQIPLAAIPGAWAQGAWATLGAAAPAVAAVLTLGLLAVSFAAPRNLPVILMYGSMAALNLLYAYGDMTRLWVPVTALIAVSLPLGALRLRLPAWAGATLGAALAANLVLYVVDQEEHPYRSPAYASLAALFESARGEPLEGKVLTPNPQAFALVTGLAAPMTVPGIGVDPAYDYVVLPSAAWDPERLGGRLVTHNDAWSLVALDRPLALVEIRPRINCRQALIPAFAVLASCPLW